MEDEKEEEDNILQGLPMKILELSSLLDRYDRKID